MWTPSQRTLAVGLLAAVAIGTGHSAGAQYNLPPRADYARATITFRDLGRVRAQEVRIAGDSVSYVTAPGAPRESLHLDEVGAIRVREGTNVWRGLGIGAALGLSTAASVPDVWAERTTAGRGPAAVFAAGTSLGAGIGSLVGLLVPRRRTYYLHAQSLRR